jgi:hypothetical protein
MEMLLRIHGDMRWLVLLAALFVIATSIAGLLRRAEFGPLHRVGMTVFTILLDLNMLMGLILLFTLPGGLAPRRIEHATTMILAVVVAHLSAIWRRSDDSARKLRNNVVVVVVALALVFVGVIRLRGGWVF